MSYTLFVFLAIAFVILLWNYQATINSYERRLDVWVEWKRKLEER